MTNDTKRSAYSTAEVARKLGVAKSTVIEAAKAKELDAFRVGARWIFPAAPLDRKLEGKD